MLDGHQMTLQHDFALEAAGGVGNDRKHLLVELLPSIIHELIQPLSALMLQATISARAIRSSDDSEATRDAIDRSSIESRRAARLVESLALLLRPSATAQSRLNDLVMRASELMRQELNERGCTLELDLADELPAVSVSADALLEIVLRTAVTTARGNEPCRFTMTVTTRRNAKNNVDLIFGHSCGFPPCLLDQLTGCAAYGGTVEALMREGAQFAIGRGQFVIELPAADYRIAPIEVA